jgi:MoaA/NifB/PqqE/SkfB family radical SAM enzyme
MNKEKIIPIKSIGLALAPDNIPSFLLDWEVTKKCNLDCSYCSTDIETGGHNNSSKHPPLEECLRSIDFMYEYVNLYMEHKKPSQRKVILNVYGGESLFHPDIVEILQACRDKYKPYADFWELTVTTTTNAVINVNIWEKIVPLIDEFTVSYHAENLPKQEKLFFSNLLSLKKLNKRVKVVVMMHSELWENSIRAIEFCKSNSIRYLAKPYDNNNLSYSNKQYDYIKNYWISNTNTKNIEESKQRLKFIGNKDTVISFNEGRACCGGRKLALNNSLSSSVTFVSQQGFKGWHCSVNWFFLFVQQLTGKVYTNKDCRTSLNSKVEPLGDIKNYPQMIDQLKDYLDNKNIPVIQCVKSTCMCGYCAPKAENIEDFKDLITRNVITDVIKYE